MQLESFRGPDPASVMKQVRVALGDDAMIVRTHVTRRGGESSVEVLATRADEVEAFRIRLDGVRAARERAKGRKRTGPYVVALVGPSGAGKSAAAMKVALDPEAPKGRRVGLLTLDTYRVGALEELQTFAEITDLPLEVAYTPNDAREALQRMRDRHVVVLDTPGRGFGKGCTEWVSVLQALDPDEIHLVVPSGVRPEVARALRRGIPGLDPTHVLFTKLDEVPPGVSLVELVNALELPARWVSEGPEIPGGLAPAESRILAALGAGAPGPVPTRRRVG